MSFYTTTDSKSSTIPQPFPKQTNKNKSLKIIYKENKIIIIIIKYVNGDIKGNFIVCATTDDGNLIDFYEINTSTIFISEI